MWKDRMLLKSPSWHPTHMLKINPETRRLFPLRLSDSGRIGRSKILRTKTVYVLNGPMDPSDSFKVHSGPPGIDLRPSTTMPGAAISVSKYRINPLSAPVGCTYPGASYDLHERADSIAINPFHHTSCFSLDLVRRLPCIYTPSEFNERLAEDVPIAIVSTCHFKGPLLNRPPSNPRADTATTKPRRARR